MSVGRSTLGPDWLTLCGLLVVEWVFCALAASSGIELCAKPA